ncbi:MAG: hydrogenase/urease maturation nickel metallochaperone HypA [Candidatus Woesearchaeota archaeon]
MHETVIVDKIIKEVKKHGDVNEVFLEIGELAHVLGNEIVETFQRIVDWKINWSEKPAVINCTCGYEGHPNILERGHDHYVIECPECTQMMPELIDGKDVVVKKIVVK